MTNQSVPKIKNYINGEWIEETGVEHVPLYNPSTGELIGEVPQSSEKTSLAAVDAAFDAYGSWRKLPISKRMGFLYAIRQAMIDHEEDLAVSIAVDQAKHISEARGEVRRVVEIFEAACTIPSLIQGETLDGIANNINGRVVKQPLGVFGGVAPFNFPALVFGWFIPYAIGVGNTFIYKPSTQSPMFMQQMGEIFNEVGLPKGVVNIVHGNRSIPGTWYEHPKMTGVCLVGSTPTAKRWRRPAAEVENEACFLVGLKTISSPWRMSTGMYLLITLFTPAMDLPVSVVLLAPLLPRSRKYMTSLSNE